MDKLKDKILSDGCVIGSEILKVDSFLNHQVDAELTFEMGKEFARIFKDSGANKILTVETSGIPVAFSTALAMGNLPLVFAKKTIPSTMNDEVFMAPVRSFTKGTLNAIRVDSKFLDKNDKVLVIDDFLATGQASLGMLDLIRQAGAKCVGFGIVVEKEWQGGHKKLEDLGYKVESLAIITSLHDGTIDFK